MDVALLDLGQVIAPLCREQSREGTRDVSLLLGKLHLDEIFCFLKPP